MIINLQAAQPVGPGYKIKAHMQRTEKADPSFAEKIEGKREQIEYKEAEKNVQPKELTNEQAPARQTIQNKDDTAAALHKKKQKQEEKADSEASHGEQLLLLVSSQELTFSLLKENPEVLQKLFDMMQQFHELYGNVAIDQLPAAEQQQLALFLRQFGLQNTINTEMTVQQIIQKLQRPEQLTPVMTEMQDLTASVALSTAKEDHAKDSEEGAPPFEQLHSTPQKEFPLQSISPRLAEKLSTADLQVQLQDKLNDIQKYVVKNDRIFLQLNQEAFGSLDIFLKKVGTRIHIQVEMEHKEVKKELAPLLEEMKQKLEAKNIQVELSYTERDKKREQREEQRPYEQKMPKQDKQQEDMASFGGLLGG
ncbi:MAG: flagellar hook-length control protein FliK [Ectobacillus sp.]